jgi:hypothetical protein
VIATATVARGADGVVRATYAFGIPEWHPTPINKLMRMHRFKRGRAVKVEYAMVAAYVLNAQVSKAIGRRRVSVTFVLKPKQRGCDPDAQLKGLLDGLKRCGAIVDDNRTRIELTPVQYRRGTATNWGTEITLEDIP